MFSFHWLLDMQVGKEFSQSCHVLSAVAVALGLKLRWRDVCLESQVSAQSPFPIVTISFVVEFPD